MKDKKVKKLGERQHDGSFPSQSEMARISKDTHKNLHLIKVLGDFRSVDEIILTMLNDLNDRVGPNIDAMAKELRAIKDRLDAAGGG